MRSLMKAVQSFVQLEDFSCVLVDGESGRLLQVHLLGEDAIQER
jgi:hypothetical protein